MKTVKQTAIAVISLIILFASCKKDKQKCQDSSSTNFDKEGECVYPADKLAGEYYVTEYILPPAKPDTSFFTAVVTKSTNVKVALKYTRSDNPTYKMPDTLIINWADKNFENMQPGANWITDDNKFSILFFDFSTTPSKPIRHNFVRK